MARHPTDDVAGSAVTASGIRQAVYVANCASPFAGLASTLSTDHRGPFTRYPGSAQLE